MYYFTGVREAQLPLASRSPSLRLSGVGHQFPTLLIFSQSFATCVGKGFSRPNSLDLRPPFKCANREHSKWKATTARVVMRIAGGQCVINPFYIPQSIYLLIFKVENVRFPKLGDPKNMGFPYQTSALLWMLFGVHPLSLKLRGFDCEVIFLQVKPKLAPGTTQCPSSWLR